MLEREKGMMRKLLLTILLLTIGKGSMGQNLVRNPSLEIFEGAVVGWKMVAGTPDVASRDDRIKARDPFFNPLKVPDVDPQKLGDIVFGDVCICQGFNSQGSEVMQVELLTPLKPKAKYEVSLYVIKSSTEEESVAEVSVALTRKGLKPSEWPYSYTVPHVSLKSEERPILASREEWVNVKAIYTAKGGERLLTIGNFEGANRQELAKLKGPYQGTYYCYDNVSVVPLAFADAHRPVIPLPKAPLHKEMATMPEVLTIEDASFAFGKYELQATTFPVLDKLVDFLNEHPTTSLEIIGYTDDIGEVENNRILSEKRAMAVKEYMLSKGIAMERITARGLGELHPKATNQTEEGRALNRRVEIRLMTN